MKKIKIFNLKNNELWYEDKSLFIWINEESDVCYTYAIIKNLTSWTKFLPISIYKIFIDNNNIEQKNKVSMSKIKSLSIWEFLDIKDTEFSILLNSGENEGKVINGWEIRYKIDIRVEDIFEKLEDIERSYEGVIEKLKKIEKNDI